MRLELTIRGLLLGAAITLVFTAANVYQKAAQCAGHSSFPALGWW